MEVSAKQMELLRCPAEWVLFGGAAGGGKSYALMLDMLRHVQGPHAKSRYRGAIFRETFPQLDQPGGLRDVSKSIYEPFGAVFNHTSNEHRFPSGAKISLNILNSLKKRNEYVGAQFDSLVIDEANLFKPEDVLFLWGRCRSACGVKPTLRMSTNPDRDSWLFGMVHWYLDENGYPDPSKSGVIRHFRRVGNEFEWFESEQYGDDGKRLTNSFAFIPSKLSDNTFLMKSDPSYGDRLMQLSDSERERYLGGCWFESSVSGTEWDRSYFRDLLIEWDEWPRPRHEGDSIRMFAVDPSKGKSEKEGDYSAICCLMQYGDLKYVSADLARRPPGEIVEALFEFCQKDIHRITQRDLIGIEAVAFQEVMKDLIYRYAADHPEYALSQYFQRGGRLIGVKDMLKKEMRIRRLDGPIRGGRFRFLNNPGTSLLLSQLRQFDGRGGKGKHDDGPDALAMCQRMPIYLEEFLERERKGV